MQGCHLLQKYDSNEKVVLPMLKKCIRRDFVIRRWRHQKGSLKTEQLRKCDAMTQRRAHWRRDCADVSIVGDNSCDTCYSSCDIFGAGFVTLMKHHFWHTLWHLVVYYVGFFNLLINRCQEVYFNIFHFGVNWAILQPRLIPWVTISAFIFDTQTIFLFLTVGCCSGFIYAPKS
jgi:hypothetical protein